ncbi:MAG: ABC transporter ATP-binding protein [Actinomycetia bacterium]|nr:ABC transporter ATP-binding protein [Actinomycetes bacterium]
MSGRPLIELRGVGRTYGQGVPVHALVGVDLTIHEGEFAAIVGPSGSGKSTLLGLIGLLDQPTTGTVLVDGVDMSRAGDRARTHQRARALGFVFQQFHLVPHLDAAANVETALLYRRLGRRRRRASAFEALDRVGLADRAHHRPVQLSGGEQQRVAIARALVTDPPIILADEPTGALDTANAALVLGLLESLPGEGRAVVMVTHDLDLAARAGRIISTRDGEVVDDAVAPVAVAP